MPGAPTNQALPQTVNPRKFAFQGTHVTGTIRAGSLSRLNASLAREHGTIDVALHFHLDAEGKAIVSGRAEAEVSLICQRCLEPVVLPLRADIMLAPVITDEQSKALGKNLDPWLVDSDDGSADLQRQIEEELLLALPMVAFHTEQCIDTALLQSGDGAESKEVKEDSPFAVLAKLKSKSQASDG